MTRLTKGELAAEKYPDTTYDCALPIEWQRQVISRGFPDPAPHFVFLYPTDEPGYAAPITYEGIKIAARLATHAIF